MSDPVEAGGPYVWVDQMAIDGDGAPTSHGDPYWQAETSLRWEDHSSLNADVIPYIAMGKDVLRSVGGSLGDLAYVLHSETGAASPAIVGDIAPRGRHHEGSIALAQALGVPSSPVNGGIERQVIIYVVFPQSGKGHYYDGAMGDAEALYQGWGGQSAAYAAVGRSEPAGTDGSSSTDAATSAGRPWWQYVAGAVGLLVIGGLIIVAVS